MYCPPFKTKQQYYPIYKTKPRLTGSQTSNATPHIRTLLYTHLGITAHGFILGKTARRIGTGALLHQKVWPPSKGLCVPPEGAPTLLDGELVSDIIHIGTVKTAMVWRTFTRDIRSQQKAFVLVITGCCLVALERV
jgi:hypothetical protein